MCRAVWCGMQIGNFHMAQRAATFVVRGSQFFMVGFLSSALGHGLTVKLVRSWAAQTQAMLASIL